MWGFFSCYYMLNIKMSVNVDDPISLLVHSGSQKVAKQRYSALDGSVLHFEPLIKQSNQKQCLSYLIVLKLERFNASPRSCTILRAIPKGTRTIKHSPNQAHNLSDSIDPIGDEQEQGEEAGGFTPSE